MAPTIAVYEPSTDTEDSSNREYITQKNQLQSPLLLLPAEIRNHVYALVYKEASAQFCVPHGSQSDPEPTPVLERVTSPLTLACRQLYYESKPFRWAFISIRVKVKELEMIRQWYMGFLTQKIPPELRFKQIKILVINIKTAESLKDFLEASHGKGCNTDRMGQFHRKLFLRNLLPALKPIVLLQRLPDSS